MRGDAIFILDAIHTHKQTDRIALVNRKETLTYRELDDRSDSFAAFLLNELEEDRTPIHVPLHGQWSDYTGFNPDRREEYYQNIRKIVGEYGVQILDLTGQEYEPYFMCDVMHLGWKG